MLTRKQLDLLDFINKRLQRDGVPPSFDEMKEALDLRSKSGIHRLITALEERGFIRRLAHRARAIEIVKLPEALEKGGFSPRVIEGDKSDMPDPRGAMPVEADALELPVMGKIAAGVPIEAISHEHHKVAVPGQMLLLGEVGQLEALGAGRPLRVGLEAAFGVHPQVARHVFFLPVSRRRPVGT